MVLKDNGYLLLLVIPLLFFLKELLLPNKKGLLSHINANSKKKIDVYYAILIPIILAFFIVNLTNPGYEWQEKKEVRLSTDIVICFDVSGSMDAKDFTPSRIEVAKQVVSEFIEKMEGNRLSLVLFAGFAFTQSPLTYDTKILKNMLSDVTTNMVRVNGTAIGDALGIAINRFRKGRTSKKKVIVLLTDGENNKGSNPLDVAKIAKKSDIKIYTIGMGTESGYDFKQRDIFGNVHSNVSKLNDTLLTRIAVMTDGKFYYGHDEKSLKSAYNEIANLEKDKVKVLSQKVFYPKYRLLTGILLLLLILEFIVIYTKYMIYL